MRVAAEKLVRLIYFGLVRRLPEATTLQHLTNKIVHGLSAAQLIEALLKSTEFRRQISSDNIDDYMLVIKDGAGSCTKEKLNFHGLNTEKKIKNIIYFCPAISWPIGGIKVILRQCEIINSLKNEIQAQVCFPEAPEFNPDWLDHNAEIKKNLTFNISTDLIVLPEVWALSYASKFLEAGIKYVIFVQNGYYILMRPSEATGSLSSYLTRLIKAPAASLPLA